MDDRESRRLEAEADAILKEDAKKEGHIKEGGVYGFGKYAKQYGILTPHDIATIRHYEFHTDDWNRVGGEDPDE